MWGKHTGAVQSIHAISCTNRTEANMQPKLSLLRLGFIRQHKLQAMQLALFSELQELLQCQATLYVVFPAHTLHTSISFSIRFCLQDMLSCWVVCKST